MPVVSAFGSAVGAADVTGVSSVPSQPGVGSAIGAATVAGSGVEFVPNPSGQSVQESIGVSSQLEAALKAGLGVISQDASYKFVPYIKTILPLDGWVFWVKASILSPSAILNAAQFNRWTPAQTEAVIGMAESIDAQGSLHLTTVNQQAPTESFAENTVIFTSKVSVQDLNDIAPGVLFIGTDGDFRFAFSQRDGYYRQADLYHYKGTGVYPIMEPQIIDDPAKIDLANVVVSNSLPMWLRLNAIAPMYPSFLVPDNLEPPYIAVDIPEDYPVALQSVPFLAVDGSHWQLVMDEVTLHFFGLRNYEALAFQDYLFQQLMDTDAFGLMNSPVVRDAKRTQVELSTLAMKKTMVVRISYYQTTLRNWARQLILSAIPSFRIVEQ